MPTKPSRTPAPPLLEHPTAGSIGFHIVVLDRGFVYAGDVTLDDRFVVIRHAVNVRVWGTTKGLGQLALEGPSKETKLDKVGVVKAPTRALISLIETNPLRWVE